MERGTEHEMELIASVYLLGVTNHWTGLGICTGACIQVYGHKIILNMQYVQLKAISYTVRRQGV